MSYDPCVLDATLCVPRLCWCLGVLLVRLIHFHGSVSVCVMLVRLINVHDCVTVCVLLVRLIHLRVRILRSFFLIFFLLDLVLFLAFLLGLTSQSPSQHKHNT